MGRISTAIVKEIDYLLSRNRRLLNAGKHQEYQNNCNIIKGLNLALRIVVKKDGKQQKT